MYTVPVIIKFVFSLKINPKKKNYCMFEYRVKNSPPAIVCIRYFNGIAHHGGKSPILIYSPTRDGHKIDLYQKYELKRQINHVTSVR
jgi:hypothetical protein